LDATDGPARIPYVLDVYEVGGHTYQLVDPWGIRLATDEVGCDISPEP
jgi:hypothetical protein